MAAALQHAGRGSELMGRARWWVDSRSQEARAEAAAAERQAAAVERAADAAAAEEAAAAANGEVLAAQQASAVQAASRAETQSAAECGSGSSRGGGSGSTAEQPLSSDGTAPAGDAASSSWQWQRVGRWAERVSGELRSAVGQVRDGRWGGRLGGAGRTLRPAPRSPACGSEQRAALPDTASAHQLPSAPCVLAPPPCPGWSAWIATSSKAPRSPAARPVHPSPPLRPHPLPPRWSAWSATSSTRRRWRACTRCWRRTPTSPASPSEPGGGWAAWRWASASQGGRLPSRPQAATAAGRPRPGSRPSRARAFDAAPSCGRPRRTDAVVIVGARQDAYVSPQSVLELQQHLDGSEVRCVRAAPLRAWGSSDRWSCCRSRHRCRPSLLPSLLGCGCLLCGTAVALPCLTPSPARTIPAARPRSKPMQVGAGRARHLVPAAPLRLPPRRRRLAGQAGAAAAAAHRRGRG